MSSSDHLTRILELARWAPSGDNTQPWRFERVGPSEVVIHGFDTRTHCVYDLDGRWSQISLGALLETIDIAASAEGLVVASERDTSASDAEPIFRLNFRAVPSMATSPLVPMIQMRSVQRRSFKTRPLTPEQRQQMSDAVGPEYQIQWLEGFGLRLRTALLMFHAAKLRLTTHEAYAVHREVIEWNAQFSEDKVPDQSLGLDALTLLMMKLAMESWGRLRFFNRFLAGTWAPRIQLDLMPSIACAAHFVICARTPPDSVDDYVKAGRAMQRSWLTATLLGLQLQPEFTPLVFARYAREGRQFSTSPGSFGRAQDTAARLGALLGSDAAERAVVMGRIGTGLQPRSRSTRRSLADLTLHGQTD